VGPAKGVAHGQQGNSRAWPGGWGGARPPAGQQAAAATRLDPLRPRRCVTAVAWRSAALELRRSAQWLTIRGPRAEPRPRPPRCPRSWPTRRPRAAVAAASNAALSTTTAARTASRSARAAAAT